MITSQVKERLYRREPVFSFEFFPPRDEKGEAALRRSLEQLVPMEPSFVSVTYGAGGSTRGKTKDIVCSIQKEYGLTTMAHLTCLGHSYDEIQRLLADYEKAGIRDILALRGDPPQDAASWQLVPEGPAYAVELVRILQEKHSFNIAVAGFPEVHPEAPDMNSDLNRLKQKVDAGAQLIITQLFFDNEAYFDYVRQARRMGIKIPIIPGIMPVTRYSQLDRFVALSGCTIPEELRHHLKQVADDPKRVEAIGLAFCAAQCVDLLRRGAPGIHFYTLNQSRACQTIYAALRSMGMWV